MDRLVDIVLLAACAFAVGIALLFLKALPGLGLSPISVPVFLIFIVAATAQPIALLMWVRKRRAVGRPGFYSFVRKPEPTEEAERAAWAWGRRFLRAWQTCLASMAILAAIEVWSGHWH